MFRRAAIGRQREVDSRQAIWLRETIGKVQPAARAGVADAERIRGEQRLAAREHAAIDGERDVVADVGLFQRAHELEQAGELRFHFAHEFAALAELGRENRERGLAVLLETAAQRAALAIRAAEHPGEFRPAHQLAHDLGMILDAERDHAAQAQREFHVLVAEAVFGIVLRVRKQRAFAGGSAAVKFVETMPHAGRGETNHAVAAIEHPFEQRGARERRGGRNLREENIRLGRMRLVKRDAAFEIIRGGHVVVVVQREPRGAREFEALVARGGEAAIRLVVIGDAELRGEALRHVFDGRLRAVVHDHDFKLVFRQRLRGETGEALFENLRAVVGRQNHRNARRRGSGHRARCFGTRTADFPVCCVAGFQTGGRRV